MNKIKYFLCFSFLLISNLSFAFTIDLSDYNLPEFDSNELPEAILYDYYIVYTQGPGTMINFTSVPMTASSTDMYLNGNITIVYVDNNQWVLSNWDNGEESDGVYNGYSSIITSNYTVYDVNDSSSIIFEPIVDEPVFDDEVTLQDVLAINNQIYQALQYIICLFAFVLICFVCKYIYKFFNMFF